MVSNPASLVLERCVIGVGMVWFQLHILFILELLDAVLNIEIVVEVEALPPVGVVVAVDVAVVWRPVVALRVFGPPRLNELLDLSLNLFVRWARQRLWLVSRILLGFLDRGDGGLASRRARCRCSAISYRAGSCMWCVFVTFLQIIIFVMESNFFWLFERQV